MNARVSLIVGLLAVITTGASSQVAGQTGPAPAVGISVTDGRALITGTVVRQDDLPWPRARVNLRDLAANRVEQVATTNDLGEFSFVVRPEISYVVEVVDRRGRVLAASQIVAAQPGDVAAALITVPSRLPSVSGIFNESIAAVLAAAAWTGITVLDAPPLSPEK